MVRETRTKMTVLARVDTCQKGEITVPSSHSLKKLS